MDDARLLLLVALASALAAVFVWRALGRAWRSLRARRRAARASRGERDAERLLERLGFEVLGRQVEASMRVEVDGTPIDVPIRVDLVVRRGRRSYVAEVKTGAQAPRIEHAPTRRQLLEYRMAMAVDGALLVDAEAGRVREVVFPGRAATRPGGVVLALLVGAMVGASAVLLLTR